MATNPPPVSSERVESTTDSLRQSVVLLRAQLQIRDNAIQQLQSDLTATREERDRWMKRMLLLEERLRVIGAVASGNVE